MASVVTGIRRDTVVSIRDQSVDIAPPGHKIAVQWNAAPGATKAEVAQARLTIIPAVAEQSHADALVKADGAGWVVEVPPNKRVKALALNGFKSAGREVTASDNLPAGMRITVAFPPPQGSGFDTPRFAVPSVGRQGAVPATLTGATFSNKVLSLNPAVAARKVRLSLVTGSTPQEFADQPAELGGVALTTHTAARNAKVTGPDGAALWEMPEIDPDAEPAEVDLRFALEAALNQKIASGEPVAAEFVLSAAAPARAIARFSGASGALVRTEDGVLKTVLEGDPLVLPLKDPLAAETPATVRGDLTITYAGIRILETASDPLPAPGTPVSGAIVGTQPALRVLPPQGLQDREPARIGIYGRAPEACELSLQFVEVIGDTVGATLSPPAVIKVEPKAGLKTHWASLPPGVRIHRPAGIRVRANQGRFFWVSNPEGQPVVRIAILDPDPGGRPVYIGAAKLTDVHATKSHETGFSFPTASFQNTAPLLRSDLFLTVDCSDLTMRYAR